MMSCKAKTFLQWLVKVLTLRNVKKSSSSHSMVQSSVHLKVKCTKCIGFSFVWKSPGEVSVRFSLHVGQHVQLSNKTLKAKQEPRVRFGSTEFLGPVWFPRIRSRNVRPTVCRQAVKLFFLVGQVVLREFLLRVCVFLDVIQLGALLFARYLDEPIRI